MEDPSDSLRGFDLFSHGREEDPFLKYLVNIANSNSPVEVGVSVTSGGFIISGLLTSDALYFEQFASAFAGGPTKGPSAVQSAFKNEIEGFGSPYREPPVSAEAECDRKYFHMKEAFVIGADGSIVIGPVWWRGRIDLASGLVLGIIKPVTTADS
ncbi:hypothetical protein QQL45_17895 [Achromobacter insolitus]|uniref:hypothetical protein n=1 Tax=Achromobacter insolitus TaxID=217204 RepID=UPI00265A312C|nr:hypothetical protein [Achromobacter insolitus]WKK15692.1 hypothetical protein QQL45_17895 [Achromobacter insolitus]